MRQRVGDWLGVLRRPQAVRFTDNQRVKLEWIAATSPQLYRAYLLKGGLRFVFRVEGEEGQQAPFLLQVDRYPSAAGYRLMRRQTAARLDLDTSADLRTALARSNFR